MSIYLRKKGVGVANIKERARVISINYSKTKGCSKTPIERGSLLENFGLENDAHAGKGERQVSLMAKESIERQKECEKVAGKGISLKPGDFGENITTEGINLTALKPGDKLEIGNHIVLLVTKIGKECHKYCAIYYKTGDCIMPREGVFAKVLKGGEIKIGDVINTISQEE